MILEESEERFTHHRLVTVRTKRGNEYVIDADTAAEAVAQLFSEYDNEKRFGWQLGLGWWQGMFANLRRSCEVKP